MAFISRRSMRSVSKVVSRLMDLGSPPSAETAVGSMPRARAASASAAGPNDSASRDGGIRATSPIRCRLYRARRSAVRGPMPGSALRGRGARNRCLVPRPHPRQAPGLGVIAGDLGDHAAGGGADRHLQAHRPQDRPPQVVGRLDRPGVAGADDARRPEEAAAAGHIQVRLIQRDGLDQGRISSTDIHHLLRKAGVGVEVAAEELGIRADPAGLADGHGRLDAARRAS